MRSGTVAILLAVFASGCVLGIDDRFTVEEPVERIVLDLGHGDVLVEAGTSSSVEVDAELAGVSHGDYGHELIGGVLRLDYECGQVDLCGGDVVIRAPSGVHLDLTVGAGQVDVKGMAGDVLVTMGTGSVVGRTLGGATIDVAIGTGDAELQLLARPVLAAAIVGTGAIDMVVPGGSYALELDATAGVIELSGVTDDPDADAALVAVTGAGSITIEGR